MACPTCTGTMQSLWTDPKDKLVWWCPRCGTLKVRWPSGEEETDQPALVLRCRSFSDGLGTDEASGRSRWKQLGIEEAIGSSN